MDMVLKDKWFYKAYNEKQRAPVPSLSSHNSYCPEGHVFNNLAISTILTLLTFDF
jgi:hypothetical protein